MLLPEMECGTEMIWYLRCGGCGGFGWFHAGEEPSFRSAIESVAKRRGEPGGLSEEGTREAHALFEESLPECDCGKSWHVVRLMEKEACLECRRELFGAGLPDPEEKRQVRVKRVRVSP